MPAYRTGVHTPEPAKTAKKAEEPPAKGSSNSKKRP
jgi:hypothetical protein